MSLIHSSSIIENGAEIAKDVEIGAFCVIGAGVKIGKGTKIHSHVVVEGDCEIGENCEIFQFASIGSKTQDLKFDGEESKVIIGNNNVIREYVTVNGGTKHGISKTTIGDDCLLMIGVHVAHDCVVGNRVIMANNVTLAGHVEVEDFAIIGGMSAVHQFVRIGAHAMIGGMSAIEKDIIPFGMAFGERAHLAGINFVGMKRRNFPKEDMNDLRAAYDMLFIEKSDLTFAEKIDHVKTHFENSETILQLVEFLSQQSGQKKGHARAVCKPKA